MKMTVKDKFLLVGVEDKGSVNLYSLIKLPAKNGGEVLTLIGTKVDNLEVGKTVQAEIELTINNKRLFEEVRADNKKNYEAVFVKDTNFFLRNINQVKDNAAE